MKHTCIAIAALFGTLASAAALAAVGPNILAVQPSHTANYWIRTNTSLNVDVPNDGVNLDKPTCAAVTYMIGSDGRAHDIVVRNTIPKGGLTMVAASAVKDFHFVAGPANPSRQPIFTYIIIPFNMPADPATRKRLTDACTLKDFPRGYR